MAPEGLDLPYTSVEPFAAPVTQRVGSRKTSVSGQTPSLIHPLPREHRKLQEARLPEANQKSEIKLFLYVMSTFKVMKKNSKPTSHVLQITNTGGRLRPESSRV